MVMHYIVVIRYTLDKKCIISTGRSGSKWMGNVCDTLGIKQRVNRVDIGVRVELPYSIFSHLTDELYESKIVYRTQKFQDKVRTFCMNQEVLLLAKTPMELLL